MFIRSPRLFLRPAWPEDRDELLALSAAREDVRARIDGVLFDRGPTALRSAGFVVTVPDGRGATPVGALKIDARRDHAELMVWIADAFRGEGLGAEALAAVMPLACVLGHRTLVIRVEATDGASLRTVRRFGFVPNGEVLHRPGRPLLATYVRSSVGPNTCDDPHRARDTGQPLAA